MAKSMEALEIKTPPLRQKIRSLAYDCLESYFCLRDYHLKGYFSDAMSQATRILYLRGHDRPTLNLTIVTG